MTGAERDRAVRRLLRTSIAARRRDALKLVLWSAIQAVPALLSGRLIAKALDDGFLAGRTTTGFAYLGAIGAATVVGAWATRQTFRGLAAVVEPFRDDLATLTVTSALRRSTAQGARPDTAAVARLTQQVEIVREAYASVLMVVQSFAVTTVAALAGLFTLLPAVLVFVVPPLVAGLTLFFAALGRMAARQRVSIMADEAIAESAGDLAGALRDVVACGAEAPARAVVDRHIDAQAQATRELARFTALRTVAVGLGGWLPLVLILLGGSWLLRHGASTGELLGALTYVTQGVHTAVQSLVRGLGHTGLWLLVTLRRIVEATADEDAAAPRSADGYWPPARRHDVAFYGVTFAYGPWADPVIDALDLDVADGEHVVVVGPSGVGKSTLAGLVCGLLVPQAGELRAGEPHDRVLIPQEAYVFTGTLLENLAYLNPAVTRAELDDAVARLGLEALVAQVGGYDAQLEPDALSAGERQLITLARAFVSPARLAVLDEATCHLDAAAEARVEMAFAERPGTLLVIAHRISSAMRARRVVVLDGTDVRAGTHEELLWQSALYRDLVGRWDAREAPAA